MRDLMQGVVEELRAMDAADRVDAINKIRSMIHEVSPFKNEPVDFVRWIPSEQVHANDYNPNAVAPPEMKLLEHSIDHDGFTQPVVGWEDGEDSFEVVDGFHRSTVAKRSDSVRERLNGYVPVACIQAENTERNDRVAATIRHNRARGKHKVESMSDIVVELKKRNWSDQRIAKELGMDADEVLRLCQVSGLVDVFSDEEFSQAWEAGIFDEEDLGVIDEEDI